MKGTCFPILLLIILCLAGCGEKGAASETVTIATSANMQFVMQALSEYYSDSTGIECQVIIGSSGKLSAQISEGAPFDLFVAANMKYPAEIERLGLAVEPPEIYAYGTLVLWTVQRGMTSSLEILPKASVRHIALANPKTAPYGQAAIEVLNKYSLFEPVKHKLVYGESISQTNQFILSGAAELGFTSLSVVLSPQMKDKGNWIALGPELYSPIEQGVVLLKQKKQHGDKAKAFYNFLFSRKASEILKKFGYSVNEPPGMQDHEN